MADKAIFHMNRELSKHKLQMDELDIIPGKFTQLNHLWSNNVDFCVKLAEQLINNLYGDPGNTIFL